MFPEKTQEDRKRCEQVEHGGGEEVDMADMSRDIFVVDEEDRKAGRQAMRGRSEREMGNAPDNGRRKECGFDIFGDDRVQDAVIRYRLDCNVTMSLSFNLANMVCEGCAIRGKHSMTGKKPMILVATDQSWYL